MSRDYNFVETDPDAVVSRLVSKYESMTGRTLRPADPDALFIAWIADILVQEKVSQNYIGNQNLPSRAEGENLDALGEWIYNVSRTAAQPSKCMVRFHISEVQETSISIPRGTRVTDSSWALVWYTTADAVVEIGELFADVMVQCETVGEVGNGYVAGQINTLIDVDNILYYASCENIETASGGANEADDRQYYELMREGLDAYSTAGPAGAYTYWAKSVSANIADVKPVQPRQTTVKTVQLFTGADNVKHGFLAGEHLLPETLTVRPTPEESPSGNGADYSYTYEDQLLDIEIKPAGSLADRTDICVTVDAVKAGYVYLYTLMNDGRLADEAVKRAILSTCNQDTVRPLTDFVSCEDAETVPYNVNITYKINRNTTGSVTDIEANVTAAVNEYIAWQAAKIGRDINPSYLAWLLRDTGIKRVDIAEPVFTQLRSGDDHSVPQVAQIGTITVTNGGFEDE